MGEMIPANTSRRVPREVRQKRKAALNDLTKHMLLLATRTYS